MSNRANITSRRRGSPESGQAAFFVLLVVSVFLVGSVAFAVDLSNMWFHRQTAQNAADAACMAGAMDLLADNQGGATGNQGFTNGTAFTCTTSSTAIPCQYASLNGYNSSSTTPGNVVEVSFPSSVTGASTPSSGIAATPFLRVDVTDHVQSFFSPLLTGQSTQDVRAFAVCGTVVATSPIPILILDPLNPNVKPATSALNIQGSPTIKIVGGPSKSIQVNSSATNANNTPWGSATIDLSQGGPPPSGSVFGTGSDIGLYGGPLTAPSGFNGGVTGHWVSPAAPIGDPFAQLAKPTQPAAGTVLDTSVTGKANGCPDPTGCYEYTPGTYSGICVGNSCKGFKAHTSAIFQPGLYYINGDFSADSGSCLRPSTAAGDGTGGTIFYFTGSANVSVNSNSGASCPSTFSTTSGSGSLANGVKCTPTSAIPASTILPANLTGNVLLAPCTGPYGDPLVAAGGSPDPTLGEQRGILFFMDRAVTSANPNWGGGGSFLLAGTMYFHSCNASGTGTNCGAAGTYYNDVFSLSGNSGSSTYVLGDIITDNLTLGGNSSITMDLNPTIAFTILKATLLR